MALTLSRKFGRNMLGPDLKYIICGAAAVPPYLIGEYAKEGISLFPGYGLTESANLVSGNPECATKPESVGIPYPGQELKLENGELWIRGKNVMTGYAGGIPSFTEDGWFRTGDLGVMDEKRNIFIRGRIKSMILNSSGQNIYPEEVEAVVANCQYVDECLVVDRDGKIVALVYSELPEDMDEETKASIPGLIRDTANKSLPNYSKITKVEFMAEPFEKTPKRTIKRFLYH